MGINTLSQLGNNLLAFGVVFFVFFWLYKNMQETKAKKAIGDFFTNMKETLRGEKEE